MTDHVAALKKEIEELKASLNRLRVEKANLQMAVHLINEVASTIGVTNVVERILHILVSAVGGTNIALYYQSEGKWKYTDNLGVNQWLDQLDSDMVRQAVEEGVFCKVAEEAQQSDSGPQGAYADPAT